MPRLSSLLTLGLPLGLLGCSNILISKEAAEDGTSHISYNADDAALIGALSHWPAGAHAKGSVREIFSWDNGKKLGEIPQPAHTFNVMGNANDQGLVIGETTHGGLSVLDNFGKDYRNGTILDYGSLIWVTLQRASTARQAIQVMTDLANTYGYASNMEGFSIADANEVWYMELIAKGSFEKGVVWVALRVPDGYIAAHANQARITTFLPCDDPSKCMMAPDAVSFAIKHGFFKGQADDTSFSFSDTYDPVTFEGARFCEARVWYVFSQLADPRDFNPAEYFDYARGYNLTNRMPLFVRPKAKLTRHRLHELMGSHFEASWFDPATDVGAGAEHTGYRWNGLTWEYKGELYVNERVVGTQATGWHFVARVAPPSIPAPMRAVQWWGADDHSYSPKIPIHGGASEVHPSYDGGDCTGRASCRRAAGLPGNVLDLSWNSAWWLNNLVADVVMTRKDRAASVALAARANLDAELEKDLNATEQSALESFAAGDSVAALKTLNFHAVAVGAKATAAWTALWSKLMVSFIDGRVTTPDADDHVSGCSKPSATFDTAWKAKVIADTGDKYKAPPQPTRLAAHAHEAIPKLTIKGVGA